MNAIKITDVTFRQHTTDPNMLFGSFSLINTPVVCNYNYKLYNRLCQGSETGKVTGKFSIAALRKLCKVSKDLVPGGETIPPVVRFWRRSPRKSRGDEHN